MSVCLPDVMTKRKSHTVLIRLKAFPLSLSLSVGSTTMKNYCRTLMDHIMGNAMHSSACGFTSSTSASSSSSSPILIRLRFAFCLCLVNFSQTATTIPRRRRRRRSPFCVTIKMTMNQRSMPTRFMKTDKINILMLSAVFAKRRRMTDQVPISVRRTRG